ncbi:VWA domain-containing protein [Spirosoma taeanense]|uniref:VWA domain-containing protein n=1 Tax=Spirosoma taeanense TaxID=2735870 RepID=A0A6M5Y7M9_9BACT|nr:DUF3883 domain-containing protein [Spirosoma taeanense]QJW89103.1 VWA domain-containing protein [Spirosoma taeanense]
MQTVTEILIDFSTSMKEKLALTKQALLNDIIPNLDYSARIGIKTFSAANDKNPIIKTILPLSVTNKEQLTQAVNKLDNPDGNTPIAAAIKSAVDSLKEFMTYDKKIILVTDGEENCGGDYTVEVNKAKTEGVNCQIHIIGIGLSPQAIQQAQSISKTSNGTFSHIQYAKDTVYSQSTIKQNLTTFYASVRPPVPQPVNLPNVPQQITVQQNNTNPVKVAEPKPKAEPIPHPVNDNTGPKDDEHALKDEAIKTLIDDVREIKNQLQEIKRKSEAVPDVVEDAELNERIRQLSEEFIFEILKRKYADRVKWLNQNGEAYEDHDFEIIDIDGSIEYYIECKGAAKNNSTFYLTKNEWRLFLNHTKNYQIYFVKSTLSTPSHIFIDNLMDWLSKGKVVPYLKERQVVK